MKSKKLKGGSEMTDNFFKGFYGSTETMEYYRKAKFFDEKDLVIDIGKQFVHNLKLKKRNEYLEAQLNKAKSMLTDEQLMTLEE